MLPLLCLAGGACVPAGCMEATASASTLCCSGGRLDVGCPAPHFFRCGGTTTTPTPTTTTPTVDQNAGHPVSVLFAVLALPALVYGMVAYRVFRATLFLAGGGAAGFAFYVLSPAIFETTPFCCGDGGTELGHVAVSALVGVLVGTLAVCLRRFGVMAIGLLLGLLLATLLLFSPVGGLAAFEQPYALILYYAGFGFVLAVAGCCIEKAIVVAATAAAGSFLFVLGVDYFANTGFAAETDGILNATRAAVVGALDGEAVAPPGGHLGTAVVLMLGLWAVLWGVSCWSQYRLTRGRTSDELGDPLMLRAREVAELRELARQAKLSETERAELAARRAQAAPMRRAGRGGGRRQRPRGGQWDDDDDALLAAAFPPEITRNPAFQPPAPGNPFT